MRMDVSPSVRTTINLATMLENVVPVVRPDLELARMAAVVASVSDMVLDTELARLLHVKFYT